MNGEEKSDSAIVATKFANKAGQLSMITAIDGAFI
jgi:hypothetical protein